MAYNPVQEVTPHATLDQALGRGMLETYQPMIQKELNAHQMRSGLQKAMQAQSNPNQSFEQQQLGLWDALATHPEIANKISGQQQDQYQFNEKKKMSQQDQQMKLQQEQIKLQQQQNELRAIEKFRQLPEGSLNGMDPKIAANITRPQQAPGGVTAQAVPPEIAATASKIIQENPNASADQLKMLMDNANVPPIYSNPYVENRRRMDESNANKKESHDEENRKQTFPLKQAILDRANRSRESIKSKSHLIELIDKGDIDDPAFVAFAESLPFGLGKRMLSNDTVEYKSGLVDEFNDLKNIFEGATKIKEIEIYENKLADLYLNDSQKKAVLKSRIDAAKADIIKEEAASEIEEEFPNITALQFNKKVNERSKSKMNNLFNSIWEQQKSIIDQAELQKKNPLDINDPEDYKLMNQIFIESGGDSKKALELAKKKGYKIKE